MRASVWLRRFVAVCRRRLASFTYMNWPQRHYIRKYVAFRPIFIIFYVYHITTFITWQLSNMKCICNDFSKPKDERNRCNAQDWTWRSLQRLPFVLWLVAFLFLDLLSWHSSLPIGCCYNIPLLFSMPRRSHLVTLIRTTLKVNLFKMSRNTVNTATKKDAKSTFNQLAIIT